MDGKIPKVDELLIERHFRQAVVVVVVVVAVVVVVVVVAVVVVVVVAVVVVAADWNSQLQTKPRPLRRQRANSGLKDNRACDSRYDLRQID